MPKKKLGKPRPEWLESGSDDEWAAAMVLCRHSAGHCGADGYCHRDGDCFDERKQLVEERAKLLAQIAEIDTKIHSIDTRIENLNR